MSAQNLAIIILFGLTALNWTIHWYTQTVTYYLFPEIARHMTGAQFVSYHRAYQARLVWAIYIPWSLLIAASLTALWITMGHSLSIWILLILNASIGLISVLIAVPVHVRIDRNKKMDPDDAKGLLRANLLRVLVATASLGLAALVAVESTSLSC